MKTNLSRFSAVLALTIGLIVGASAQEQDTPGPVISFIEHESNCAQMVGGSAYVGDNITKDMVEQTNAAVFALNPLDFIEGMNELYGLCISKKIALVTRTKSEVFK